MNPDLQKLQTYPFEKLARLKAGIEPPRHLRHIAMSIGEPRHPPPPFVLDALRQNLNRVDSYPATAGMIELRAAAASWLERRFNLPASSVNPQTMVLPVNGTREALFAFVQTVIDRRRDPLVMMPNPFYQIYEGASLLAGAEPCFLNTTAATGFVPDLQAIPADSWRRCQLLFLCSPANPTGTVLPRAYLQQALELAERYDFIVAADECYAELYLDESSPPPSLLEAALASGRDRFQRCIVFHSLSKRSSVPGMRSGFVAGDPELIASFLLYRTYHGSAMSQATQLASIAAWNDDTHAVANRRLYQEKFARVIPILQPLLNVPRPEGAFYLWPEVGSDDAHFARDLFATQNLTILPGSYLARATPDGNPGYGRVRISLVAGVDECVEAALRIADFLRTR